MPDPNCSGLTPTAPGPLDRLVRQGLLEERTGRVRLTDLGRRFAGTVAVELL